MITRKVVNQRYILIAIRNDGTIASLSDISLLLQHGDIMLKEDGTIKIDVESRNKVSGKKWETLEIKKDYFVLLGSVEKVSYTIHSIVPNLEGYIELD